MAHLAAVLKADNEQRMWQEYVATVLYSVGRMIGGDNYPIMTFAELMHPQPKDERTGGEIISGLIDKLRKEVDMDGGNGAVSGSGPDDAGQG